MALIKISDSLFSGILAIFIIVLIFASAFVLVGIPQMKKSDELKKQNLKSKGQSEPQKNSQTKSQPPMDDQQRLHEIEKQMDFLIGAVQANPMSPATTSNNGRIMQLEQEKQLLLRKIGSNNRSCPYEDMIQKALESGKIKYCILGYGEYCIPSRNVIYQNYTDYELLLLNFDWYQQVHPDKSLKEIYEQVLEEMLRSERTLDIHCAALCARQHIKLEQNPNFKFHMTDKDKILQLVDSAMEYYQKN
ncbi:MAG: hypothetical protein U0L05_02385 [Schaedlerella sp.]|nr:hypothetical protein [Schaedlerella sp.]